MGETDAGWTLPWNQLWSGFSLTLFIAVILLLWPQVSHCYPSGPLPQPLQAWILSVHHHTKPFPLVFFFFVSFCLKHGVLLMAWPLLAVLMFIEFLEVMKQLLCAACNRFGLLEADVGGFLAAFESSTRWTEFIKVSRMSTVSLCLKNM